MRLIPLVSALCASAGMAAAEMTEVDVTITSQGQNMIGTLMVPDGDPAPVVLLFHGFTGARDELAIPNTDEGVFSRTARILAENGFASLRIDFIGSGESDGDFADTTFEGQVADGLAAVDFATADPRVNGDNLMIIGWSQGGLVATAVAGRSDIPDAVALWAAVADPEATFGGIVGAETLTSGMTTGDAPLMITLPWGAEIGLKQAFFEGVSSFDPPAEIAGYAGPIFVTQGNLDTTVAVPSADMLLDAHEGVEMKYIRDMDHVFNVFTETGTLDEMIGATMDFFWNNPPE